LGQGKSGSLRTLIAFQVDNKAFLFMAFPKAPARMLVLKK